jgi:hypothetical protein
MGGPEVSMSRTIEGFSGREPVRASYWRAAGIALTVTIMSIATSLSAFAHATQSARRIAALVERGRYLIEIGGCNDCHTDGFAEADAKTPR